MVFAGSLDANVVLRLLLNDVPEQNAAAVRLVDEQIDSQLAVADTAIVEVVFVLERYYELTRAQIAEMIEALLSLGQINANRALFSKALPLFVQNPGLSFEDCCLTTYAELNGAAPLCTFDKTLAKCARSAKLLV